MMGGGDILTLQRILGHSSITMTMRYAHLSPEHLESAMRLSPLAQLSQEQESGEKNWTRESHPRSVCICFREGSWVTR